ncbi:hypothetical protein Cantr_09711 [Candida viswanathii]|uniref:Uncharacterized protein n=1 Tax=Candida viswanathii TaxID=5486 RepID=A0A367YCY8_9ASCO|nr:hypothetical protein Cantr_09711 [Candida viswanathii]
MARGNYNNHNPNCARKNNGNRRREGGSQPRSEQIVSATYGSNNNRQGSYDDDVADPAEHLTKTWELLKDDVDDDQHVENERENPLQIISVWPTASNIAPEVQNRSDDGNENLIVSVFCDPDITVNATNANTTTWTIPKRPIPYTPRWPLPPHIHDRVLLDRESADPELKKCRVMDGHSLVDTGRFSTNTIIQVAAPHMSRDVQRWPRGVSHVCMRRQYGADFNRVSGVPSLDVDEFKELFDKRFIEDLHDFDVMHKLTTLVHDQSFRKFKRRFLDLYDTMVDKSEYRSSRAMGVFRLKVRGSYARDVARLRCVGELKAFEPSQELLARDKR